MLGRTNAGGGAGLNFKIAGNPKPGNPAENTIWVDTETPITSWIFSEEKPSPAEDGMVWFNIGTSSAVAFNALKKNGIMVYPISAKQYVNGAWVDVEAKSYQNGVWEAWATIVLDKANQAFDFIVDSLHIVDGEYYSLITDSGDYVEMTAGNGTGVPRAWQWKTAIDLSKYSLLEVTGYSTGGRFGIANSLKGIGEQESITETASMNFTESERIYTLDISQITSVGYIGFYASKNESVFVKQIRLL
jgi:hypothetical protein